MAKKTELQSIPRSWASDAYVGANSIGANAVQSAMIADGAVGTSELAAAAVTGVKASADLRKKTVVAPVPTVATTGTTEMLIVMPFAGTITSVTFAFKDNLAQHASNYLTFAIVNKGTGAGAVAVLSTGDNNTTKTTTGIAVGAYSARFIALGTGANIVVAAQDVLAVQFISNATLANTLTEGVCMISVDVPT